MAKNVIEIIIKADGSGAVSGVEKASKSIGGLGSSIATMAAVAGGTLIAGAISSMGNFFKGIAGGALEAVGNAQNLEIALEGLLTQSLMYQQVSKDITVANTATAEQTQRLQDLRLEQQIQTAQMQEQRQRIIELTAAWGDNGLNVQTAKAKLADMENTANKTTIEIDKLENATRGYSTITEKSWEQVMNLADAQGEAKKQSQDLLGFVKELAIVSPFETTQVENVTKLAVASGLATDQVKEFTKAFLGAAAVQGIKDIEFAADQFLQLRKIGKLTTIDLRQLRRMGLDVERMLGTQLGMTVEEFNAKAEKSPEIWDDFNKAFVDFVAATGGGAALDRMAGTVTGMKSTMSDVVEIGSRDFFRPIIEAASPFVAELVDTLSGMVTGGGFAEIGAQIGGVISDALSGNFFQAMQSLNIPPEIALTISDVANAILGMIEGTRDFKGLLLALGLNSENIQMILDAKDYIEGIIDAAMGGNFFDILAAMGLSGSNITAVYEISGALNDIWSIISDNLIPSSETMGGLWNDTLLPAIVAVGDWINANLLPFLADLAGIFEDFIAELMPTLVELWDQLRAELAESQPAVEELFAAFGELAAAFGYNAEEGDALDIVLGAIKIGLDLALASVEMLSPAIGVLGETISYIAGVTTGFLEDFTALVGAFTSLNDTSISLIERLGGLSSAFMNFMIPDELIPGSPTPFEMGLRGIGDVVSGILPESFATLFTLMTELMTAYLETMLKPFNQLWIDLYETHFPILQEVFTIVNGVMLTGLQQTLAVLQNILAVIMQIQTAMRQLGEIAKAAAEAMSEGFKDAGKAIEQELWPAIKEAIKLLERLEHQAVTAKGAISQITGSERGSADNGGRFQHGTGGIMTVPGVGTGDTFRAMLTPGEQFAVAPRGVDLRRMLGLGSGGTVINMTNNITTSQPVQDIVHSLEIARAMIPA